MMMSTGAKRMITTTTRVYPPIPPMSSPVFSARRGLGNIRWVPTIFALELMCVFAGYGVSAYRRRQIEKYSARSADFERQQAQRRRTDAMLMDAYGEKSSLEDLQNAMATYEAQRRQL